MKALWVLSCAAFYHEQRNTTGLEGCLRRGIKRNVTFYNSILFDSPSTPNGVLMRRYCCSLKPASIALDDRLNNNNNTW